MKNVKFFVLIGILLFAVSCQKDDEIIPVETITTNTEFSSDGMVVLGEKLEDPYSVPNMNKAYESLKAQGLLTSVKQEPITATHLYVRFLPKNETELTLLYDDKSLDLFDYPLDYEIKEQGSYYHDPDIPEGEHTWLYTSVSVSYNFPNVAYEIIEECYIPEDSGEKNNFAALMEYESFKLTDNLTEEESTKGLFPPLVEPNGQLRVHDTEKGNIGISKVKIRVSRFTKIKSAYTDANGNYNIDLGFRYSPSYSVIFQNETGFRVWGNWYYLGIATWNFGLHSNYGYSPIIYPSQTPWLFATINNGTYYYRETICPRYGVTKPASDLKIWALRFESMGLSGGAAAPMCQHVEMSVANITMFMLAETPSLGSSLFPSIISNVLPDIFVVVGEHDTRLCYVSLFHELSHASHFEQVDDSYWMSFVTATATHIGYGDGTGPNDGYIGVSEMWGDYFGHNVCCKDYFGYTLNWIPDYEWIDPGILMRLHDFSPKLFSIENIFKCFVSESNTHDKLKAKMVKESGDIYYVHSQFGYYGH